LNQTELQLQTGKLYSLNKNIIVSYNASSFIYLSFGRRILHIKLKFELTGMRRHTANPDHLTLGISR
jgi:hypothetical protein